MQNSERKSEFNSPRSMPPISPARQERFEKMAEIDAAVAAVRVLEQSAKNRPQTPLAEGKGILATRRSIPKRATPNYPTALGSEAVLRKPRIKRPKVKLKRERLAKFDYVFFITVIVLLAFGIVMMFSASYAYAYRVHGDSYYYVLRQLTFIGIGLGAMLFLSFVNYHIIRNKFILKVGSGVAVGLMLFASFVVKDRWIYIGNTSIQPSEILKFVVIAVLAYLLHENYSKLDDVKKGFRPLLLCVVAGCLLTITQEHLSATIIIFLIGLIMLFVGDCKIKHIGVVILVCIVAIAIVLGLIMATGQTYYLERVYGWLDPEMDIRGTTFQTYQSLVTIGSGGVLGLGLGNSRQKYAYLPESHNDFIFSIICEELGFIGAIVVILLFLIFVGRGFWIAVHARDRFGMMLAVGITSHLGVQALLNIGVVSNSIPNTGISLPFFSYGGSALIMQLAEIGVLLNISRNSSIR